MSLAIEITLYLDWLRLALEVRERVKQELAPSRQVKRELIRSVRHGNFRLRKGGMKPIRHLFDLCEDRVVIRIQIQMEAGLVRSANWARTVTDVDRIASHADSLQDPSLLQAIYDSFHRRAWRELSF